MTTPSDCALSLRNVSTGYDPLRPVLRDVTLEAPKGSITGLLGRNGAGKTTLIHSALGLFETWRGRCELFGCEARNTPPQVRARIGFVPQELRHFHWLKVSGFLRLVGSFYDDWNADLVADMQRRWQLPDKKISALSPGMRQRVAVLIAIGHQPDLLVMDEPAAALDPGARRDLLRLIGDMNADTQQTVVLLSHICSDIERICSDVAILHEGRIALHMGIDELKEDVRCVAVDALGAAGAEDYAAQGQHADDVLARREDRIWLRNWQRHAPSEAVRPGESNLEDLFLDITA